MNICGVFFSKTDQTFSSWSEYEKEMKAQEKRDANTELPCYLKEASKKRANTHT